MKWLEILDYVNVAAFALTFIVTVVALIVYMRHVKHASYSVLLFLFIVTCVLYSLSEFYHFLSHVFQSYGIHITTARWTWQYLLSHCAEFQTYICGAGLALDRVILMFFPTTHNAGNVTRRICYCVAFISVLAIAPTMISNTFSPLEVLGVSFHEKNSTNEYDTNSVTYKIYDVTVIVLDVIFLIEVVLHAIFGVQFYRYSKMSTGHRNRPTKTSQIIFIQVLSQSTICMVPKFVDDYNHYVHKLEWVRDLYKNYYPLLYAVNLIIINSFIIRRIGKQRVCRVNATSTR